MIKDNLIKHADKHIAECVRKKEKLNADIQLRIDEVNTIQKELNNVEAFHMLMLHAKDDIQKCLVKDEDDEQDWDES
jgi:hypothetical protein